MEWREAAAAGPDPKVLESHGYCDEADGDLISRLPDDVLGVIVSRLPTKDGGRTQALSRRWCHLWRSAPLNLEVRSPANPQHPSSVPPSAVPNIIAQHPGPARRFSFHCRRARYLYAQTERWFNSRALGNLQELDVGYGYPSASTSYPLPRSASTVLVAKIRECNFPDAIARSVNFLLLKQLSLDRVSNTRSFANTRSFSPDFCEHPVFQGMGTVSSANSMSTVKVLAVGSYSYRLNAVLDVLRWFPCLGKLYVTFHTQNVLTFKKNVPHYDRPQPMECLQAHLKEVVLKYFNGYEQQIDLARFFVLNAKVLNKIEFHVREDQYNNEFVDRQHTLLQAENRASPDAQFEFRKTCGSIDYQVSKHIHDMSVADPFVDSVDA